MKGYWSLGLGFRVRGLGFGVQGYTEYSLIKGYSSDLGPR